MHTRALVGPDRFERRFARTVRRRYGKTMKVITERPVAYFLISLAALLAVLGVLLSAIPGWPYASSEQELMEIIQFVAVLVIAICLLGLAAGGKRLKAITGIGAAGIALVLYTTDLTIHATDAHLLACQALTTIAGIITVVSVLIAQNSPDGFGSLP